MIQHRHKNHTTLSNSGIARKEKSHHSIATKHAMKAIPTFRTRSRSLFGGTSVCNGVIVAFDTAIAAYIEKSIPKPKPFIKHRKP
jgi:hypothetical protein